jgi:hypothetical protein
MTRQHPNTPIVPELATQRRDELQQPAPEFIEHSSRARRRA